MTPAIKDINTPAVRSIVHAYLLARTFAEVQRERVDEINLEILNECPICADKKEGGEPITRSKDLYLSSDEAACQDFYAESDARLRKAGIKPHDMPRDYCPALVAENQLRKIERELVNISGKPFGVTADGLLCARGGLDNWKKWVDLVCKLIVNQPDFEAPKL